MFDLSIILDLNMNIRLPLFVNLLGRKYASKTSFCNVLYKYLHLSLASLYHVPQIRINIYFIISFNAVVVLMQVISSFVQHPHDQFRQHKHLQGCS